MILQTLIVEDDSMSLYSLEQYCQQDPQIHLLESASSAEEALPVLQQQAVDLLILDVGLPGLTGLEMLQKLVALPNLIFVSSEREHAFQAFKKWDAVDYLLKPVSISEFKQAIDKVQEKVRPSAGALTTTDWFIKSEGKLIRVGLDDILFIKNIGDYIVIYLENGEKHISYATLKSVEDRLRQEDVCFQKVHRSFIINTHKIDSVESTFLNIRSERIPISRSKKDFLLRGLNRLA